MDFNQSELRSQQREGSEQRSDITDLAYWDFFPWKNPNFECKFGSSALGLASIDTKKNTKR